MTTIDLCVEVAFRSLPVLNGSSEGPNRVRRQGARVACRRSADRAIECAIASALQFLTPAYTTETDTQVLSRQEWRIVVNE